MTRELPPPNRKKTHFTGLMTVQEHARAVLREGRGFYVSVADHLEPIDDGPRSGRPRQHPIWTALLCRALKNVFGSYRRLDRELCSTTEPWLLNMIIEEAQDMFPDRPDLVPRFGMLRQQMTYYQDRFLAPHQEFIAEQARQHAYASAQRLGLGLNDQQGSLTHPSRDKTLYADGKIIKSRFKQNTGYRIDKETGEKLPRRDDPDAELVPTGGEGDPDLPGQTVADAAGPNSPRHTNMAYGHPYVLMHIRGDEPNQRIILGVARARRAGGEMAHAVPLIEKALQSHLDIQAVAYDAAARGKHRSYIQDEYGIPVLAPPVDAPGGKPREVNLGAQTFHGPGDRKEQHAVVTIAGYPHLLTHDEHGTPVAVRLERLRNLRRENKGRSRRSPGRWTNYSEWCAPDGSKVRLRLSPHPDSDANRGEHLHAIPRGDPDYAALYGRRNDAESHHKQIDDRLIRERVSSVGESRVTADQIAWQVYANSCAVYLHTQLPGAAEKTAA